MSDINRPLTTMGMRPLTGIADDLSWVRRLNTPTGTFTLPPATVGQLYLAQLEIDGGVLPIDLSLGLGTLPAGLLLVPLTRTITGIPLTPGTFTPTILAVDAKGDSTELSLSLTVSL